MSAAGLAELGLSLPAAPAAAQPMDVEMAAEEVPKAAPQMEKDLYTQVGTRDKGRRRMAARERRREDRHGARWASTGMRRRDACGD